VTGIGKERAWYIIRVRGIMDPDWSTWFPEFNVAHDATGDTILSGEVMDRAAFYGFISRARDLGLMVISIERRDHINDITG
jgi:hypothetical protein